MKHMKSGFIFLLLLLVGCAEKEGIEAIEQSAEVNFTGSLPAGVDTASIFFFRKDSPTTDSLLRKEIVAGNLERKYELPAGYYNVVIMGNADPVHISTSAGSASSDLAVEYPGGEEPPVLYRGMQYVNIGKDNQIDFTLTPVTSAVELLVEELPANVAKIAITLFNTATGIYLNGVYVEKSVSPPISRQFSGVDVADTLSLSCFPTVTSLGKSYLEVVCYDLSGEVVFHGKSGPFIAKAGIVTSIRGRFSNQVDFTISADTDWKL